MPDCQQQVADVKGQEEGGCPLVGKVAPILVSNLVRAGIAGRQRIVYNQGMELSDLVTIEREKRGWTKAELARRAGVSKSVITRLEKGERVGLADTVLRVITALGIPSDVASRVLRGAPVEAVPEGEETQLVDLTRVPPEDRPALRRAIAALLREWERGGKGAK